MTSTLDTILANYPEQIQKIVVVNAPTYLSLLYSMIRPFLPENTKNKIVCILQM